MEGRGFVACGNERLAERWPYGRATMAIFGRRWG